MKKLISILLCISLLFCCVITARAEEKPLLPTTSAEAYVLYCADNGEIISSLNENKKMKPASTTKLMTTLIALEQAASSNKKLAFTNEMIAEGSSMYLKTGEVVTLKDLAAGMQMASGNDAANAAAMTISGSKEKFAELMNTYAKRIGMKNTHFVTPSGLDDENHYSTAYDMALLMTYALENEDFAKLTSQKSATVEFVKPASKRTTYSNHNKLLSRYEYCIGGKTGYTMAAGRCLVSAAKKDGLTLVCVTLNDRNDWDDHIALYNYGFDKYSLYESDESDFYIEVPCVGGNKDTVTLSANKSCSFVLNSEHKNIVKRKVYCDSFLYAPISKNDSYGRIDYELNGKTVTSVELVAVEDINYKKENKNFWEFIKEMFTYG